MCLCVMLEKFLVGFIPTDFKTFVKIIFFLFLHKIIKVEKKKEGRKVVKLLSNFFYQRKIKLRC